MGAPQGRWQATALIPAVVILLTLLGSCLFGWDRLAFRDVSHFYTPLYGYLAERTDQEALPLWNPMDQTGMPILGETTTALLYPIRYLLGALPLAASTQIAWYVFIHLVIAAWTAKTAARRSGAKWSGQCLAAVLYPLSGSVFFLYSNPPFLVGAAWLPLAMTYLIGSGRCQPDLWNVRVKVVGLSLGMMILGGDPQTALHCVLVSVAFICLRKLPFGRRSKRPADATDSPSSLGPRSPIRFRHESFVVLGGCTLAILLSLPQMVGSLSWGGQSRRANVSAAERSHQQSWFAPPIVGSRKHQAMRYSFAPWHYAELLSPAPYGSVLPRHRRISAMIPGDGYAWTPSIFMGVLPMFALLHRILSCRFLGGRDWARLQRGRWENFRLSDRWILVALLGGMLAMGQFGLVWFAQWLTGSLSDLDSATWGPYWWLYHVLPGYDAFRYPAKWLPFLAVGLSVFTAVWIDHFSARRLGAAIGTVAALIVIGLVWTTAMSIMEIPSSVPANEFWGPFQQAEGFREAITSWWVSLAAVLLWGLWFLVDTRARARIHPRWILFIFVGLVALETGASASRLLVRVSVSAEAALMKGQTSLAGQTVGERPSRLIRAKRDGLWPRAWGLAGSPDRLAEVEASQRLSGFGRWHLASSTAVFNNFVSIQSDHQSVFWSVIGELESEQSLSESQWQRIRNWLGIDKVLTQSTQSQPVEVAGHRFQLSQFVIRDAGPTPSVDRGTLAFDPGSLRWLAPSDRNRKTAFKSRLREVIMGSPATPLIHHVRPTSDASRIVPSWEQHRSNGQLITTSSSNDRMQISVDQNTLVVRPVFQDGHWKAQLRRLPSGKEGARSGDVSSETVRLKVFQADFLKQAVFIPPGRWEIRYHYSPWWWLPSLVIAIATACLLLFRFENLNNRLNVWWKRSFMRHR